MLVYSFYNKAINDCLFGGNRRGSYKESALVKPKYFKKCYAFGWCLNCYSRLSVPSSVSHFYARTNLTLQTDLAERHWYFTLETKQFTSQVLLIITYCISRQTRCSLAVLFCSKTSKYTLSDCNFYFLFSNHFNILDFCPKFNSCGDYFHVCITNAGVTIKQLSVSLCLLHLASFIWHLILKPVSRSYFILIILGRGKNWFIFYC